MSKSDMRLSRARKMRFCWTCDRTIWTGSLYCKRTGECGRCWLDRLGDIRHTKPITFGYSTPALDVVE